MCYNKISQESRISLELWHVATTLLWGKERWEYIGEEQWTPGSQSQATIMYCYTCTVIFSLCIYQCTIFNPLYVRCILCRAKSWILYKGIQAFASSMNHTSLENTPRCYAKLSMEQDGNILWQVGTLPDHTPVVWHVRVLFPTRL